MSLSTTWRDRQSQAEAIAAEEIYSFFREVQPAGDRILVQFDEKEVEEDIAGKVVKRARLAVILSFPWLQREQLIFVIPMERKTGTLLLNLLCILSAIGEAVAEEVYGTLNQYEMENSVFGCLADTTASNFGQWSGAITLLQVTNH